MSTIDKGNELEDYVVEVIKEIDGHAYKKGKPYDVISQNFVIECKNKKGQTIGVSSSVYDKLLARMARDTDQIPIVVRQIDDGRKFVIMELEDLKILVDKIICDEIHKN